MVSGRAVNAGVFPVDLTITGSDGAQSTRTATLRVLGAGGLISAGAGFVCGITTAGAARCWGDNQYGQLGTGDKSVHSGPVAVTGLSSGVVAISAGGMHACALLNTGVVTCWGADGDGQLGTATEHASPAPIGGSFTDFIDVSAGGNHTCGVSSGGAARCWGSNNYGQLGTGSTTSSTAPVTVSGQSSGVRSISAGTYDTCLVTLTGAALCWGDNTYGQVGVSGTGLQTIPQTPRNLGTASGIAVGDLHACAVRVSGKPTCWGHNAYGQLGDQSTVNESGAWTTVAVSDTAAVDAGGFHSCALSDGVVRCWGSNATGELGDGTTTQRLAPVAVVGLGTAGVDAISAGGSNTCARFANGTVSCWGANATHQLGAGASEAYRTDPVPISGF